MHDRSRRPTGRRRPGSSARSVCFHPLVVAPLAELGGGYALLALFVLTFLAGGVMLSEQRSLCHDGFAGPSHRSAYRFFASYASRRTGLEADDAQRSRSMRLSTTGFDQSNAPS